MPKTTWHVCHHCDGAGCEVCEEHGGWFETAAERDARLELAGWPRDRIGGGTVSERALCRRDDGGRADRDARRTAPGTATLCARSPAANSHSGAE